MNSNKPRPTEEEMWAGPSGERWLANAVRFEKTLQPIGQELIRRAAPKPGEHVIDVGCGAGAMSLEIATRVMPGGSVTGLDISPALVAEATRRAAAATPRPPATFHCANAATADLPTGKADCLVSRFGIMFFTDPYAAFGHLRQLLKPGGRMVIAAWISAKDNAWMAMMRQVIAEHMQLPEPPPRAPGPFAFEEPDYLRDILTKAGFSGIGIEAWRTDMYVGGMGSTPESAGDFLLQAMSVAQRIQDMPPETQKKIRAELVRRLAEFSTPNGVKMPAATWFATARA